MRAGLTNFGINLSGDGIRPWGAGTARGCEPRILGSGVNLSFDLFVIFDGDGWKFIRLKAVIGRPRGVLDKELAASDEWMGSASYRL